jgi:hypothetical protein
MLGESLANRLGELVVTFERARQIVYEAESGDWGPGYNFHVPPYGWETDEYWFVLADIRPDDRGDAIPGYEPLRHVHKHSGEYGGGRVQVNGRPAIVERTATGLCIRATEKPIRAKKLVPLSRDEPRRIALVPVGDWTQDPDHEDE